MKNEPLQPSENLAKHFAPYREEAPLVSTPEIEKLLAGSAIADHPHNAIIFKENFYDTQRTRRNKRHCLLHIFW